MRASEVLLEGQDILCARAMDRHRRHLTAEAPQRLNLAQYECGGERRIPRDEVHDRASLVLIVAVVLH